jgi:hypothetical protein
MSRMLNKKTAAIVSVLFLIAAGGAYAYFTQSGTGSGTAATGSGTGITVNQTSTPANLTPGSTPLALSGTFTNTNSGSVGVATITATVTSVTGSVGTPACTATDYAIAGSPLAVNATIAAGTGVGGWGGGGTLTIAMVDKVTNQDACKGATANITYSSN